MINDVTLAWERIQIDCNTYRISSLKATTKDVKVLIAPGPGLEKSSGKINTNTVIKKYQSRT